MSIYHHRYQQRARPSASVDHRDLSDRLNRLVSKSSIGSSLPSLSSLHSVSSLGTMPAAKVADGSCSSVSMTSLKGQPNQRTEEEIKRDLDKYSKLQQRKALLEEKLLARMKELLAVCMKEGEMTGEMPKEIKKALRPGEEIPRLQKRVGTSFSIPEELITADKGDKMGQLETDVELHRRIVAAAERLAKDKSMNKSVRKKRQKDYQAAAQKLRGLELGLSQMRLSASKPDVSSLGSNNSANSWNGNHTSAGSSALTRAMAQSCPTTPRGSVPDLRAETDKSDYEDDEPIPRRAPSVSSRRSLAHRFSAASSSSSSLGLGLPPSGSSRRSLTQRSIDRSITSDELDNPLAPSQSPIYENVGYRSTSYRSSYRQAHYPTIQDDQQQHLRKRAVSAHSISRLSAGKSSEDGFGMTLQRDSRSGLNGLNQDKTPSDEDSTPTAEHPQTAIRRLPQSISCGAGFTNSLDRRAVKTRPVIQAPSIDGSRRESLGSAPRGASPAIHRITTFPVCHANQSYDSASALPRFQPPIGRPPLSHFPARGALPHYGQSMNNMIHLNNHHHQQATPLSQTGQSQSSGRLPAHTDPHMEALLDFYKKKPQQKTATIV